MDTTPLTTHLNTLELFNRDLQSILSTCSQYKTDCACAITIAYDSTAHPSNQYKIRMNCDNVIDSPEFVNVTNNIIQERAREKLSK
jgi:hypothetical protein